MVALHLCWVYFTVLQYYRISLFSLDFIKISPFLICFELLRKPFMRFPSLFILFLQLYNVDMTFQNNLLILNCKRALTCFQIVSSFLYPKMTEIKPPFGPLIIDIDRQMVPLLFHLFCVIICFRFAPLLTLKYMYRTILGKST